MSPVNSDELVRTIRRMEKRFANLDEPIVQVLFAAYGKLISRFEDDLADEHDVLLSRAAALMLIQEAANRTGENT